MFEPGSTAVEWGGGIGREGQGWGKMQGVWGILEFWGRPTSGMGSPHIRGCQGSAPRPGPPVFVLVWLQSVALQ